MSRFDEDKPTHIFLMSCMLSHIISCLCYMLQIKNMCNGIVKTMHGYSQQEM